MPPRNSASSPRAARPPGRTPFTNAPVLTMNIPMIDAARCNRSAVFSRFALAFLAVASGTVATMNAQAPEKKEVPEKKESPAAMPPAAKAPEPRNRLEAGLEQLIEQQD